jgi:hypothetical protein
METFTIKVSEVLSRNIEIQASNLSEAIEIAKEMYNSEEIVLDYRDHG